jgi:thioester reductase-like protein
MKTRRLDKDFDGSDPRVVSLASDLAHDQLGLKKEVYDEMAKDVTMVIHVSLLL